MIQEAFKMTKLVGYFHLLGFDVSYHVTSFPT